jgi:hypothetical protein
MKSGCQAPSHRTGSLSFPGTEFFEVETGGAQIHFIVAKAATETKPKSKSPHWAGVMHTWVHEFDSYGLGGGRDRDRTCDPLDVNEVLSR